MAGKKINDLTALGRNLASTDLLELSLAGGTGSRKITGQEIINAIPLPPSGITIGTTAITSGTVGRILFEGTGNVVQESANLFWDNTNGRLGINNATPTQSLDISGAMRIVTTGNYPISLSRASTSGVAQQVSNSGTTTYFGTDSTGGGFLFTGGLQYASFFGNGGNYPTQFGTNGATRMTIFNDGNVGINTTTNAGFKLDVNGTARVSGILTAGSTINQGFSSSTTNVLLSTHTTAAITNTGIYAPGGASFGVCVIGNRMANAVLDWQMWGGIIVQAIGVNASLNSSAILQADSTTKGFLPPRMTTTQVNAIASPAAGLVVYNTTISHLCVYQAGAWVRINHSPM
jgi:hypothetical protein